MKPEHATLSFLPAAASALFALQHHAEASIVYSGPNQNLTLSIDPDSFNSLHLGVLNGLSLVVRHGTSDAVTVRFAGLAGNAGLLTNGSGEIKKLAAGVAIRQAGTEVFVAPTSGRALAFFYGGGFNRGSWAKSQVGFDGFKLTNGDYGWIRLEWTGVDTGPTSITAVDWAYNNVPGQSIQTGQTVAAPEPGTIALLALAGAGAAVLRRKRRQKD